MSERAQKSLEEKFWSRVETQIDGCWIWTGGANASGYGQLAHAGRVLQAHRVAWELLVGEIPPEFALDHLCRVPGCVAPHHLDAVTSAVNQQRTWCAKRFNDSKRQCTHCERRLSDPNLLFGRDNSVACRACGTIALPPHPGPYYPTPPIDPLKVPGWRGIRSKDGAVERRRIQSGVYRVRLSGRHFFIIRTLREAKVGFVWAEVSPDSIDSSWQQAQTGPPLPFFRNVETAYFNLVSVA